MAKLLRILDTRKQIHYINVDNIVSMEIYPRDLKFCKIYFVNKDILLMYIPPEEENDIEGYVQRIFSQFII